MKRLLSAVLCLALCVTALLVPYAAADAPQEEDLLLLQAGTAAAVRRGETVPLTAAPRYAANGSLMVPLRPVAELLDADLTWDPIAHQGVVTRDGHSLAFTEGGWSCLADGASFALPAAPEIVEKTLYVPALALGNLPDVAVHVFGYYEGAYVVVSGAPLTEALLQQCHAAAVRAFGPNAGLLDASSLVLRCGSRHAWVGGKDTTLCDKGGDVRPFQRSDGYLMLPVRFCAESLGGIYAQNADGSSTVTLHGHTAVFPAADGAVTVDGQQRIHAYYAGTVQNGTAYCSAFAFSDALGYFGYADAATGGVLLTPYNLAALPALQARAWTAASSLVLQRYEDARGYLALTFDDGPSGQYTTRLLDGLKARGVHATFFLCDYRIQTFPGLMSRYLSEGHEVGNHSANHATLTACSAATLAAELDKTSAALRRTTDVSPVLMRPPGGAYNGTVLSAAGARGMSCIMWSLDTMDWKNRNVQAILQRALPNVRDGDIILMHDMYQTSVDAALSMIDTLQAQGYVFVTVSELARLKGAALTPGVSYSSLR